jgi:hypothetical protein
MPSVRTRSKMRDIEWSRIQEFNRAGHRPYTMKSGRLSFQIVGRAVVAVLSEGRASARPGISLRRIFVWTHVPPREGGNALGTRGRRRPGHGRAARDSRRCRRCGGMLFTVGLRRQTEHERNKHEADCLLLFGRKDKNLATGGLWAGRRVAVSANRDQSLRPCADSAARCPYQKEKAIRRHSIRRLTWSDRYFRRIFSL